MLKYLAVLLFLLLNSCVSSVWHGDISFSQEERAKIEVANQFIAYQMGTRPYDIIWDGDPVAGGGACFHSLTIVNGGKTIQGGGLWVPKEKCIYLDTKNEYFLGAAAHEFGHSRGLPHLDDQTERGLMNSWVGPLQWTPDDQKSCERWLLCGPR